MRKKRKDFGLGLEDRIAFKMLNAETCIHFQSVRMNPEVRTGQKLNTAA